MDLILDTSIVIEIFGGNERILEHLRKNRNRVFGITSVTEFELFCVDLKEKEVIMLDSLPACDFDKKAGRIAGNIYKDLKKAGKMPKIKDLLIAATCIANNKRLITGDGDFETFKGYGLDVEVI